MIPSITSTPSSAGLLPTTTIDDLPADTLTVIFRMLPQKDLRSTENVSREWRVSTIQSDAVNKFKATWSLIDLLRSDSTLSSEHKLALKTLQQDRAIFRSARLSDVNVTFLDTREQILSILKTMNSEDLRHWCFNPILKTYPAPLRKIFDLAKVYQEVDRDQGRDFCISLHVRHLVWLHELDKAVALAHTIAPPNEKYFYYQVTAFSYVIPMMLKSYGLRKTVAMAASITNQKAQIKVFTLLISRLTQSDRRNRIEGAHSLFNKALTFVKEMPDLSLKPAIFKRFYRELLHKGTLKNAFILGLEHKISIITLIQDVFKYAGRQEEPVLELIKTIAPPHLHESMSYILCTAVLYDRYYTYQRDEIIELAKKILSPKSLDSFLFFVITQLSEPENALKIANTIQHKSIKKYAIARALSYQHLQNQKKLPRLFRYRLNRTMALSDSDSVASSTTKSKDVMASSKFED